MNDKMRLDCEIKLKINGVEKLPEEIINQAKEMSKKEIRYGESLECSQIYKNGKLYKNKIKNCNDDEIDSDISGGGIYFLFSTDEDKLLYLGKAKDLRNRLKQHLIECAASTHSHILDVIEYLRKRDEHNKELSIKYCIINTENNVHNAAIEGALIDYVVDKSHLFGECWNIRQG